MPIYKYKRADGEIIERQESIKDERLKVCPETGMKMEIIIQPKCENWYGK